MNKLTKMARNRIRLVAQYLKFKFKYPDVKIVKPLKIGTFYSQDGQDLYLAALLFNYLNHNSNPWIVDVGCNHPRIYSNSFFFEQWFDCRTLAIDPLEEFSSMWAEQRPAAVFENSAIGRTSETVVLRVPSGERADNMFAAVEGGFFKEQYGGDYIERSVRCSKLSDMLTAHKIAEILLLSIDVEGSELDVLRSIDFEACLIRCIVFENNSNSLYGSDDIRDYLLSKNYIFHARVGHLDDIFVHGSMINGRY